jgi:hypothetical protein
MTQKNNLKLDFVKKRLVEMKKDIILALIIFFVHVVIIAFIEYMNSEYFKGRHLVSNIFFIFLTMGILSLPFFIISIVLRFILKDVRYCISGSVFGLVFYSLISILQPSFFKVGEKGGDLLFSLPGALIAIILFCLLYNFVLKNYIKPKYIFILTFLSFVIGFTINNLIL